MASKVGTLVGYAAKFGGRYELYDDVIETIAPGAFARTLKEMPDVRALYNHDTNHVLGRTTARTLRLSEDAIGLPFEVDLPDTSMGRDTFESVDRRDITGCSFGFQVIEEAYQKEADGTLLRTLLDVDLFEISPAVAFPAYVDTEVEIKSSSGRRIPTRAELARSQKARIHREQIWVATALHRSQGTLVMRSARDPKIELRPVPPKDRPRYGHAGAIAELDLAGLPPGSTIVRTHDPKTGKVTTRQLPPPDRKR